MFGKLTKQLWAALRDTCGTTTIEYAFMISLIGIAAVGGFTHFANEMDDLYGFVAQSFTDAQNN